MDERRSLALAPLQAGLLACHGIGHELRPPGITRTTRVRYGDRQDTFAGAKSLCRRATGCNIRVVYLARGVRGFGVGVAIIVLPAYLSMLGYEPAQIGIVATASL